MTTPPFPHPSGARPPAVPADLVPRHVAIVMDGNGRWANARGLPRTKGHEAGEASLLDVVAGCIEIGVAPRLGLRVLDRELEALARRGPLPHGLQPRRDPAPPGHAARVGRPGPVVRPPAPAVAQRHQGARGRPGDDPAQRRAHADDVRQLRRPGRDRRRHAADRPRRGRRPAQARLDRRAHHRPAPRQPRHARRRPVRALLGGAAHQQLPAVAVGLRRDGVPRHAVARLRPARPLAGDRDLRARATAATAVRSTPSTAREHR